MLDPNTTTLLNQLGYDAGTIESLMSGAILIMVATLLAAIPTAMIARRKNRSRTLWLLFALSIPLVPLLLICLLPALPRAKPPAEQ